MQESERAHNTHSYNHIRMEKELQESKKQNDELRKWKMEMEAENAKTGCGWGTDETERTLDVNAERERKRERNGKKPRVDPPDGDFTSKPPFKLTGSEPGPSNPPHPGPPPET